jgi:hypothetical protein
VHPSRPRDRAALVAALTADVAPVRPLRTPGVRLLAWLAVVAGVAAVLLAVARRPDAGARLARPAFAGELLALALAAVGSAAVALRLAVPGRTVARLPVVVVVLCAAAGLALGARVADANVPTLVVRCVLCTLVIGTIPALALLVAIRRAAPLMPTRAAAAAGGAAFLAALGLMRLVCPLDAAAHLAASHLAPAAAATAVAVAVGGRWVARWRR